MRDRSFDPHAQFTNPDCKADAIKRLCRKIAPVLVVTAAILAAAACAAARQQIHPLTDRGALILRLGPDTLFVERFELTAGRLYVESVVRAPAVTFRTIDATLNPDRSLAAMKVATFDPANPRGGTAKDSAAITFREDSTIYSMGTGSDRQFLRLSGRGDLAISIPGNLWFPNYILVAARAPRVVGDSIVGTMTMRLGAYPMVVKRVARDTLTLWSQIAGVMRVILGPDGRLAALDGTGSSIGYIGTRIDWIDIDSVSRAFAARERAAGVVGTLSGRDTVLAELAGARLTIDYGRPTKRGRAIFGNVVPWNRVWRTGANLATHFSTSGALQFSETVLPAGTYTLHTIPAPAGWTLLVSRQTGQWGTSALDPTAIVARIPMRVSRAPEVVETFTIEIHATAVGGTFRMAWDDTVAEADFSVR